MSEPLDLLPKLRTSLIDGDPVRAINIAELLDEWKGEPAVFTRRPIPEILKGIVIICNPPISIIDEDALASSRPIWSSTIAVYGPKGEAGSPEDKTRDVEAAGWRIRELFHRQKFSVQPEGFSVIDVVAGGPVVGPTDDDNEVARIVSIRVRLRRI